MILLWNRHNKACLWVLWAAAELALWWLGGDRLPQAQVRGLGILILAVFLWAGEMIPLHAASLTLIAVSALALGTPHNLLPAGKSYQIFYAPLADPVVVLFLTGFLISRALQKYSIDSLIATAILNRFGRRNGPVLLGFMLSTAFVSMWMSNTAAAAMMIAVAAPVAAGLRPDHPMRKSLALGIAFGANIGGIATPIGTPPNAIAIASLQSRGFSVDFLEWTLMALPLAVILLLFAWLVLLALFRSPKDTSIPPVSASTDRLTCRQRAVLTLTAITLSLWLSSGIHHLPSSLIGLLAASALFATGLLEGDDLKKIEWDVLILMWGGLVLGEVITATGLTARITEIQTAAGSEWIAFGAICAIAVLLSTFMSNTAAANIMIPIALSLPASDSNRLYLAVATALSCSMAMALPVSTPPNAIAFTTKALRANDLLKAGLLISITGLGLILAGYRLVIPIFVQN